MKRKFPKMDRMCAWQVCLVNMMKVSAESQLVHRSPVLKDECAEGAGREVELVLDVRTRWNSTLRMLKNFMRPWREASAIFTRKQIVTAVKRSL